MKHTGLSSDAPSLNEKESQEMGFPLDTQFIDRLVEESEIDLEVIGIRNLKRLVDAITEKFGVEFMRFEFGIPGLPATQIGIDAEKEALDKGLANTYAPFDGIPRLKKAASEFLKNFLNVDVGPENCVPTVGAMQGCFLGLAICGRLWADRDTILCLDPGFPVNKLQIKFLGLRSESIDLFDHRGQKLVDEVRRRIENDHISAILYSNPNNPTWISLTEEELAGIGEICNENRVVAIEDLAYFCMDFRKDFSRPGVPPYPPSIGHHCENFFIIVSGSKIFSYAGQRVAIAAVSPELMTSKTENLRKYFNTDLVGSALIQGGVYVTTACTPQTTQHALAAMMEAANRGELDFVDTLREYGERAVGMKEIFLRHGFKLAYDNDMEKTLADGFYFTVARDRMTSGELVRHLLYFGMAGIPLGPTGSLHQGVRICVSLTHKGMFEELERRLAALDQYILEKASS
jgi:aspartate/methionine/tyrosine aminotransferase